MTSKKDRIYKELEKRATALGFDPRGHIITTYSLKTAIEILAERIASSNNGNGLKDEDLASALNKALGFIDDYDTAYRHHLRAAMLGYGGNDHPNLKEIIDAANNGYNEGLDDDAVLRASQGENVWDTLAEFVAIEIIDTFEPELTKEEQITTAIDKMETAILDLTRVQNAVEKLYSTLPGQDDESSVDAGENPDASPSICEYCHCDMKTATTCIRVPVVRLGKEHEPVRYQGEGTCPDCGVHNGGYHHPGCDNEECPICGGQAFGCACTDAEEAQKEVGQ